MRGMVFDGVHSYNDLNMVLSSVGIPPATPKTVYVPIPGGDGSVDLSEALGEIKFEDRECEFVFSVFPQDDFEVKKRQVSNLLNGRRMHIAIDKDPGYYWDGRCSVNEYETDGALRQITVGAVVKPYKYKDSVTTRTINLTAASQDITVTNARKSVVPTLVCTGATVIEFADNRYELTAGTHRILDIMLRYGDNLFTVSGSGTLTISYQEGDL